MTDTGKMPDALDDLYQALQTAREATREAERKAERLEGELSEARKELASTAEELRRYRRAARL
jgi:predicted  nucleic acid-binding Zn-ribbon protein